VFDALILLAAGSCEPADAPRSRRSARWMMVAARASFASACGRCRGSTFFALNRADAKLDHDERWGDRDRSIHGL
jgi:hypothetical protein